MKALTVRQFRNYEEMTLEPRMGVSVLTGPNGAGKTNVLEALHLCCLGKSHRTNQDKDMIRQNASGASVVLRVERNDGDHEVQINLFAESRQRKQVLIHGKQAQRMGDLMGHATCVIFSPEDIALVKDGPQVRRRFLDMLLCQQQRTYFYTLQSYQTALKQRNALLKLGQADQLPVWDEQLANAAEHVVRMRREAIQMLRVSACQHYQYIGGRPEEIFDVSYAGLLNHAENIREEMLQGLWKTRAEDFRRCTTSFGPHRDDLELTLCGQPLRAFGSQGQIRTAALSLKLAAFDYLEKNQSEPPLLLLDDVLSELDPDRRKRLIERISSAQAFLTCTDPTDYVGAIPAATYLVGGGKITLQV